MGLDDRDYMRTPEERSGRPAPGWSLDLKLAVGIAMVGVVLGGIVIRGFEREPSDEYDPMTMYEAYYDREEIRVDVNRAPREELLLIPLVSPRIADGIIKGRPFRLQKELLEVPGVGEVNMEIILMYLYGFEDLPAPHDLKPPGIPDV